MPPQGPRISATWGHDAGQLRRLGGDHRVGIQRLNAFVQLRSGGIEHRHNGRTGLLRHIHHLENLARVLLADRAAAHGEILCIDVDGVSVDRAVAGHDARVRVQRVQLHKARLIEQAGHALASGQLAGLLLLGDESRVAGENRLLALTNDGQIAFHTHFYPSISPVGAIIPIESKFKLRQQIPFSCLRGC